MYIKNVKYELKSANTTTNKGKNKMQKHYEAETESVFYCFTFSLPLYTCPFSAVVSIHILTFEFTFCTLHVVNFAFLLYRSNFIHLH